MLYLIKSYDSIKIGSTKDVKTRMKEYKTHNPYFELLDIADGDVKEEKELHNKLKKYIYKNSREWFIDCPETRKVWEDYVSEKGRYEKYYVEYCKPYTRRISKYALLKYGLFVKELYGQPLYNIITKEKYKHIQEWIEKEKLGEDAIYDLFLKISTCPMRFTNPKEIISKFSVLSNYKNMEEAYKDIPFNMELYLSNKKCLEQKLEKKTLRALDKFNKCPKWITENLEKNREYSFEELENIFKPLFEQKNVVWEKSKVIKDFFPYSLKRKSRRKGNTIMNYYIFNIF